MEGEKRMVGREEGQEGGREGRKEKRRENREGHLSVANLHTFPCEQL